MVAAAVVWMAGAGCSDTRFDRASQQRLTTINRTRQHFVDRENEADARLAHTRRVIRSLQNYHADRIDVQRQYYRNRHERELRRWPGRAQRQRDVIKKALRGKPDRIPRTFAHMFY